MHARVFRHRALPWVLYAEVFPARVVHVMYQHKHNGSILDMFLVPNWPKIDSRLVTKELIFASNWLQNRCLVGPNAPALIEALTANSGPRFWTPFGVPFGGHWRPNSLQNLVWMRYAKNVRFVRREVYVWRLIWASFSRLWKRDLIDLISR